MKNIEEIKQKLKELIPYLKEQYGVSYIGIFGSYIKGEENRKSDLDILVELKRAIGLLKFIEMENYLSDKLGVKVDLVMKDVLKPRIGKHILKEVVNI